MAKPLDFRKAGLGLISAVEIVSFDGHSKPHCYSPLLPWEAGTWPLTTCVPLAKSLPLSASICPSVKG